MAETSTIWAFCLMSLLCFLKIDCQRYGSKADTLHFPPLSLNDKLGKGMHVIEAKLEDEVDSFLHRFRRGANGSAHHLHDPPQFEFKDNHTTLIVHWAGQNSKVIIALTRNGLSGRSGSEVFVSYNYGENYTDVSNKMQVGSGNAHISRYYNTPTHNSHYVFTDIENDCLFTTTDYARTFRTRCNLPFKPRTIAINNYNSDLILAMDHDSEEKELYVSKDFGFSWRKIQDNVKSFSWGVLPYDNTSTIYIEIERDESDGNIVYKSNDLFYNRWEKKTVMEGVKDFELRDRYLFATKKVRLLGATHSHTQLWVSSDRGDFEMAEFPTPENQEYYIADASEDQVMVCVNHNRSATHLYISEVKGLRFSLSLENVVYYNPKGANKDTWLKYYTNETFADIHRVDGMRGIYIASQLTDNTLELDKQRSLITFDKGGVWQLINAPAQADQDEQCKQARVTPWSSQVTNCSLHLTQQLHRYNPNSHASTILSRKSAPGIIMASGVVGLSLKSDPNIFMSSDAGVTWRQVMHGSYLYTFADHGGILVAGKQYEATKEIYFSLDEGETWQTKHVSDVDIRIYGILTEPGEATTVFSLFGSKLGHHSWILIQVNMSEAFTNKQCHDNEYKWWSFSLKNDTKTCLLGRHMLYKRRINRLQCYNGEQFVREKRTENCPCTRLDYECDFGFVRRSYSYDCIQDMHVDADKIHTVPSPCRHGTYYPYSRGYRKVAGDSCSGGEEHRYAPLMYSCPIAERQEFVVYSTKTKISRINLDNNMKDDLITQGLEYVSAVEFDYRGNCVFWADITLNKISRVCLRGSEREVVDIVTKGLSHVESLAFDWTADTLYWVDSVLKGIYVVNKNGHFKRTLYENSHMFEHPRGLALDPHHGYLYWTDWSYSNPRIQRAWMDGTNSSIETIVNNTYLRKPFGLTIDLPSEKLYWTDTGLFKIMTSDLNGQNIRTLVHGSSNLPHPYSIGVYKNNIYWTDPFKQAVMTASKTSGIGVEFVSKDPNVVDMKVVSHTSQNGRSACSENSCSQLCMPIPPPKDNKSGRNRTCKCGDGTPHSLMTSGDEQCLCEDGEIRDQGECKENSTVSQTCSADRFQCDNNRCIPATWRCDHDNDCGDHSDERDCPYSTCPSTSYTCADGRCIPSRWRCDFDNDCGDFSDERDCVYPTCSESQFQCNNSRCINKNWVCDLDNDCHDGSDEGDCHNVTVSCNAWEFQCNDSQCISSERRCDGTSDCSDGSDEITCHHNITCPPWRTLCKNESRCIFRTWICDGETDCTDGSDEEHCDSTTLPPTSTTPSASTTCHSWQYHCENGLCVWHGSRCDGYNDCGDNSDEQHCGNYGTSTPAPTTMSSCSDSMWMCREWPQCIDMSSKCDGHYDCRDQSDESDCQARCHSMQFDCYNSRSNETRCIANSWVCDGTPDCAHQEDEADCGDGRACSGQFQCLYSSDCVPMNKVCDGVNDCPDDTDERGCYNTTTSGTPMPYTSTTTSSPICDNKFRCSDGKCLLWFDVCDGQSQCYYGDDESLLMCRENGVRANFDGITEAHNMTIRWDRLPGNYTYLVSYLPLNDTSGAMWKNKTITRGTYSNVVTHLQPNTAYRVTVYTVLGNHVLSHPTPKIFKTREELPTAPTHFSAHLQPDAMYVNITWEKPHKNWDSVYGYRIYYKDVTVNIEHTEEVEVTGVNVYIHLFSQNELQVNHKYEIKITALTIGGESKPTGTKTIVFSEAAWNGTVSDLTVTFNTKDNTAVLHWTKVKDAVEYTTQMRYKMSLSLDRDDDIEKTKSTKTNSVTFSDICPGQSYTFRVFAVVKVAGNNQEGKPSLIRKTAPGPKVSSPDAFNLSLTGTRAISVNFTGMKVTDKKSHVIYQSTSDEELEQFLIHSKKVSTLNKKYDLNKLLACERYYFRVALQPGCPVSPVQSIETVPDATAAPKHVQVHGPVYGKNSITANITWDTPCDYEISKQKYVLERTTMTLDGKKVDKRQFLISGGNSTLSVWYQLKDLKMNVYYVVRIRTNMAASDWSSPVYVTPREYEAPEFILAEHVGNGQVMLAWRLPSGDTTLHTTKVLYRVVVTDAIDHSDVSTTLTRNTSLSLDLDLGHTYAVNLSFSSDNKTFGPQAVVEVTVYNGTMEPAPATGMLTTTNLVVILVPIGVVVIILVSLLTVYIVRHRRLQRSFLAFANSHYDPRSGTTTFTAADDLGDDDDAPLIHGFSDDVPMVIA